MSIEEAIRGATDPASVLQRIVEEATNLLPAATGASVLLLDGDEFSWVCGSGLMSLSTDLRLPVWQSLAGQAVREGRPISTDDAQSDPRASSLAVAATGTVATVSLPLRYENRPIGCLVVGSPERGAFGRRDVALLDQLASFISTTIATVMELNRITAHLLDLNDEGPAADLPTEPVAVAHFVANVLHPGAGSAIGRRREIEQVLSGGLVTCLQPIVELSSREMVGAEALARFPTGTPVEWFEDAHRLGLGMALEEAAVRLAIGAIDVLPSGSYLAVNLTPLALASEGVMALFEEVEPSRVVLELTEHLKVEDYPALRRAVSELRRRGFRLAIDDTGAGFASLSHIIKLDPDIIKLDLDLTRGIDGDPVRRSLATSLVTFSGDTGAVVIAEGIETEAELATLLELGIDFGQGYLLGRPVEPEALV